MNRRPSAACLVRLLFWFFLLPISKFSSAADIIATNQSIRDGETLISAGEGFELGFFTPGNSGNRYVGIWYKKLAAGTVVWVANRETPLRDKSGVLRATERGTLELVNRTGGVIWSSNSSESAAENPVAQLLDTGNLVFRCKNDANTENFLWQSFDYPCDTLLPGMKLGFSRTTGQNRVLTSWKNIDDPSPGDIVYGLDPHGYPQLILRNGSVDRFRIGPWNGLYFVGMPVLKSSSVFRMEFVVNHEEAYYRFELVNSAVLSRVVVLQTGYEQRWKWNLRTGNWVPYISGPRDDCDIYATCGGYGSCNDGNPLQFQICGCLDKFVPRDPSNWNNSDWSKGCVRRTPLNCHAGDGFLKYSGVKLPDTRNSRYEEGMNLEECMKMCLKDCSCMAYANLDIRNGINRCLIWFGDLMDIRDRPQGGEDIYIRMASSELDSLVFQVDSNGKKRKLITMSLALSFGTLVLVVSLIGCVWIKKQKSKEGINKRNSQRDSHRKIEEEMELPLFKLDEIVNATDNFSIENKLGEGGFGFVYKGILGHGQEIAVKRLSKNSAQGVDEFKNEAIFIAKLQHRNLVKLLGCCIQGEEKLLIYEYMHNKCLDSFLSDQSRSEHLDWPKRFEIINGVARGLLYLHHDSRLRIIHRDIKASNILLDREFNAKISDFGLARRFQENEPEENTSRVIGTYGYMSPEYVIHGNFSVKSDTYSFGVLVLEIVSGKKNRGFFHPNHHLNLLGHAWKLYKEGKALEIIDKAITNSCCSSHALRSIHIGLLCVQHNPKDRPNMSSVIMMLGSDTPLPHPKQPGFYTERILLEAGFSSITPPDSVSLLTITRLQGR